MRLQELIEQLTELKNTEGNIDVFGRVKNDNRPFYLNVEKDKIVDDIEDNIYWSENDTGEKVIVIDMMC